MVKKMYNNRLMQGYFLNFNSLSMHPNARDLLNIL